jgi:hypothetical protein
MENESEVSLAEPARKVKPKEKRVAAGPLLLFDGTGFGFEPGERRTVTEPTAMSCELSAMSFW